MNLNSVYSESYHHLNNAPHPKQTEAWYQVENDLWRGAKDVLVNTAALEAREAYFNVIRVTHEGRLHTSSESAYTL